MRPRLAIVGLLVWATACGDIPAQEAAQITGTVPPGVLAAVPFQNRLDVAQGIFQMKLYNGTDRDLDVAGVQFVWDGLTTEVARRDNALIAGDRLDFPVPLAAAHCAGDGTEADMPALANAYVRVLLADGSEVRADVYDVKHFARALYLQDCERQRVAREVTIEWVDVQAAELDGRPITTATLRFTRGTGQGAVRLLLVTGTVLFTPDSPALQLPADQDMAATQVRFLEGRCDSHALGEASQPFEFSLIIDLGDGVERPYALPIPAADQVAMRHRLEDACRQLGHTGVLGQDDLSGATTTTGG